MSLIKKREEIELPKTIIGCIMGVCGIGKTTLALSAPKPLLIDTDFGIHRVQAEYRTDCVQVKSYQDILDVLEEDLSAYETVIIDTLGELVNFMLKYFAENDKSLITRGGTYNIKIWGLIKQEFQNLKMKLQLLNKHLIFVSHVKEDKDGENKVYRMDVAGSTSENIIKILDFLGFCEVLGKSRSVSFSPSARFYAKNSIQLDDYIEIPLLKMGDKNDFIEREIINPTLERRKAESAEVRKNEENLKTGREYIKDNTDPNICLQFFKEMDLNPHSKMVLFNELSEKFKDFVFDKKKGEFVECAKKEKKE